MDARDRHDRHTHILRIKRAYRAVLQWARQQGCPWDEGACSSAAGGGHLAVLQWARQHGCPWNRSECLVTAEEQEHVHAWILAQAE